MGLHVCTCVCMWLLWYMHVQAYVHHCKHSNALVSIVLAWFMWEVYDGIYAQPRHFAMHMHIHMVHIHWYANAISKSKVSQHIICCVLIVMCKLLWIIIHIYLELLVDVEGAIDNHYWIICVHMCVHVLAFAYACACWCSSLPAFQCKGFIWCCWCL